WKPALDAYKALGINTIDLYVIWNWHELRDGEFDFTGRTNDRRDLVDLLKLIHSEGYALILRPGPVIRNEWRNGGYPDWLLKRPEYNMPLPDILEGRYPATATYQNAHSDAAAAEWMANKTHMRYAARWLQRVYALAKPYKRDVVAVALDDDQGAYIDNDTWPGTHFHAYMQWLKTQAQRGLPGVPVFINTYQMKVTASAPVWAWGNWYQSDAYSIGEHDRAQIEFSTGLLQTQSPQRPIMVSEFQAGWLQGADETQPRAADPSNTDLALHTFLQMGAHGVVNFPVQDTWNPAGWEAPWANEFYAWDAAYGPGLAPQARLRPTALFGSLVSAYGAKLAQTHPVADAAIAYTSSAYDEKQLTNENVYAIAAATVAAQTRCRALRITCALVDLRYDAARLHSYRVLIVPDAGLKQPLLPAVEQTLAAYRRAGGKVVATPADAPIDRPAAAGIPNAVLLLPDDERFGFLDIVNYGDTAQAVPRTTLRYDRFSATVPDVTVPARSGRLVPLTTNGSPYRSIAAGGATGAEQLLAIRTSDGFPHQILRSGTTAYDVSACSGARIFSYPFSSIGGARDGWTPQVPPSPRDYIAKYTHPLPTGTFNRCYRVSNRSGRGGTYTYTAPDAPGGPAVFTKTVALDGDVLETTTSAAFASAAEQPQQIWSFTKSKTAVMLGEPDGAIVFDPALHTAVLVQWPPAASCAVYQTDTEARFTLTYAPKALLRVRVEAASAQTAAEAQARYAEFAKAPQP
ncbi:MAG TPA: alpha-amylase family protein, partial [Candidatus Baltobacteraceae bacterium]|nr:alpha-amylase family protein [Candidatus Baltobacteraceae bacterium]